MSAFVKGHQKVGGRKLKSRNKINRDVAALLDKLEVNPIEGMARIAADPRVDVAVRGRMHSELAKYIHPQLKQTDVTVTGKDGAPLIPVEMIDALIHGRTTTD